MGHVLLGYIENLFLSELLICQRIPFPLPTCSRFIYFVTLLYLYCLFIRKQSLKLEIILLISFQIENCWVCQAEQYPCQNK